MVFLSWRSLICAVLGVVAAPSSHGALLGFAREAYVILPGETVALEVRIHTSSAEPDDLFSYGLRLTHQAAGSLSVIGITVPAPLGFFQFSTGALTDPSESVIGVKGNVELLSPMVPYAGELLATFEISFDAIGEYEIGLDFFNLLGANEQIFLSGDGTVLDDTITFGSTTVRVLDADQISPVLALERSGAGGDDMDLRFPTIAGLTYAAQTSDDLADWNDLVTCEGDGEEFFFRDSGGGAARRGFYRVTVTTAGR